MLSAVTCRFSNLGCFAEHRYAINIVVEAVSGSMNVFEYESNLGHFRLRRQLSNGQETLGDMGFVPKTLDSNGRALKAFVVTKEPTFVGCVIDAEVVGGVHFPGLNSFIPIAVPVASEENKDLPKLSLCREENTTKKLVYSILSRLLPFPSERADMGVYYVVLDQKKTILCLESARSRFIKHTKHDSDDRFEGGGN